MSSGLTSSTPLDFRAFMGAWPCTRVEGYGFVLGTADSPAVGQSDSCLKQCATAASLKDSMITQSRIHRCHKQVAGQSSFQLLMVCQMSSTAHALLKASSLVWVDFLGNQVMQPLPGSQLLPLPGSWSCAKSRTCRLKVSCLCMVSVGRLNAATEEAA